MVFTSAPEILSPTGVLIPVLNMSMRPLIGIVQALVRPGTFNAASISLTSSCGEMVSGVTWRKTVFSHSGDQDVYQVETWRHCDLGLRMITVSSMESGAG